MPIAEAGHRVDLDLFLIDDAVAQAKSFTFDTSEQLELIAPDGSKRAMQLGRRVIVRRPDGVAFELHGKGDTAINVVAFYDGKTATLSNSKDGVWAQSPEPATLDEMLNDVARRFGLPVPIGDVMYSSPYEAYLGKKSKGGFVGRDTIDGVSYAVVDYGDELVGVKLWIPSSGPPLPRRLELTYKTAPVPLTSRVDFTNWKLDAPVNDAMFAFEPPAGSSTVAFGDFVNAMYGGAGNSTATSPSAPATPAAK